MGKAPIRHRLEIEIGGVSPAELSCCDRAGLGPTRDATMLRPIRVPRLCNVPNFSCACPTTPISRFAPQSYQACKGRSARGDFYRLGRPPAGRMGTGWATLEVTYQISVYFVHSWHRCRALGPYEHLLESQQQLEWRWGFGAGQIGERASTLRL